MSRPSRLLTAYFVTAQVTLSYVALVLSRRFRGAESYQRATRAKHQLNARRIEAAIVRLLRWFMPDYGFDTIYREIREMVSAELDYRLEASAMQKIAANFTGRSHVRLPRVMTEFSTARVLTTEWIEGAKVEDLPRLEAEHIDRRKAAQICVEAYCQQIFVDGLYHADPHPGNLLLQPPAIAGDTPTIVFLDFGATASVSEGMRRGMVS